MSQASLPLFASVVATPVTSVTPIPVNAPAEEAVADKATPCEDASRGYDVFSIVRPLAAAAIPDDAPPPEDDLSSPYSYFGGKRGCSELIWQAFGKVANYVEPFFGSGAALLTRPRSCWGRIESPGTETVNDLSRGISNFWRAIRADPDGVAEFADFIVSETDLHSRHRWLVSMIDGELARKMAEDPDYYDVKIAGWWVWGACSWIGTGWCPENNEGRRLRQKVPHLSDRGSGITAQKNTSAGLSGGKMPELMSNRGITRELSQQIPHLSAGQGINRSAIPTLSQQLPHMSAGRGINREGVGDMASEIAGSEMGRRAGLREYLSALASRMRGVRVACGDWTRVLGDSVTWRHGKTAVFLDPPYQVGHLQYAAGGMGTDISTDVRKWAIEAGKRPDMLIILAGLEGEHDMPPEWQCVPWKARGGYGSQGETENNNRFLERLWMSPACVRVEKPQLSLFGA